VRSSVGVCAVHTLALLRARCPWRCAVAHSHEGSAAWPADRP